MNIILRHNITEVIIEIIGIIYLQYSGKICFKKSHSVIEQFPSLIFPKTASMNIDGRQKFHRIHFHLNIDKI
jgi:hypothetical protein